MKTLKTSYQFTAFLALLVLVSCTSTKFSSVWKDETYQGRPVKIMVVSTYKDPGSRRLFEDELVKAMKEHRVDAAASYAVLPDQSVSDKNAITLQAKALGADTVLINKPGGARKEEVTGPWSTEYNLEMHDVYITTQTEVYDMKSGRLIMTASADTWVREGISNAVLLQSYIRDLVRKLSQQGLI